MNYERKFVAPEKYRVSTGLEYIVNESIVRALPGTGTMTPVSPCYACSAFSR